MRGRGGWCRRRIFNELYLQGLKDSAVGSKRLLRGIVARPHARSDSCGDHLLQATELGYFVGPKFESACCKALLEACVSLLVATFFFRMCSSGLLMACEAWHTT